MRNLTKALVLALAVLPGMSYGGDMEDRVVREGAAFENTAGTGTGETAAIKGGKSAIVAAVPEAAEKESLRETPSVHLYP